MALKISDAESWAFKLENDYSPPKRNMAPENRPMEKEIPIGNQLFLSLC